VQAWKGIALPSFQPEDQGPSTIRRVTARSAAFVRVCRWLATFVYGIALASTTYSEAFGPGGLGISVNWSARAVERVFDRSPAARAGVRSGDVIDQVDGRVVRSYLDWFSVRASFERDRPIPLQLAREGRPMSVAVVIGTENWRQWTSGTTAFRVVRFVVLIFAIVMAFRRPRSETIQVLALMLLMIATAEAFPPSGWAAHLRHLPLGIGLAAAFGSVSWLLIAIPGCAFGALVGGRRFGSVLAATIALPLLVLTPVVIRSCALFIDAAAVTPIQTSNATRLIQSIWGVVPQLFLGVATPSIGPPLVIGWAIGVMVLFVVAVALATPVWSSDPAKRHRARVTLGCTAAGLALCVHNVLVRNWPAFFVSEPPPFFGPAGFVIEAVVFVSIVAIAGRQLLRRPTFERP